MFINLFFVKIKLYTNKFYYNNYNTINPIKSQMSRIFNEFSAGSFSMLSVLKKF